jgi:hypothetical protein
MEPADLFRLTFSLPQVAGVAALAIDPDHRLRL